MKLTIRTILNAPAERVWQELCTPRLLDHVCRPMQTFEPIDPPVFPDMWEKGSYRVRVRLGGKLPLGEHTLEFSFPEAHRHADGIYLARDNGHGDAVPVWDHLMTVRALPDGRTEYSDAVEIRSGVTTLFNWAFAYLFYRHRQRKWRRLVAADFVYDGPLT